MVVVDVLRAFSTAAYAFAAGARAVVVAGLDFGNSPASVAALDLAGTTLIEYSAGGVRGLIDCDHADEVLAGSLVCARATAEYIHALEPALVTFVITGLWTDRDGDEDHACADLIEAYLIGLSPRLATFEERVRQSDFGRRFGDPDHPHLPIDDLDLCARADRFGFAMPIRHDGGQLIIAPAPWARSAG